MARVHYEKLRFRDVARKGQECMRKLRSMTLQDSSTDDSVSDDCSASHDVTQNADNIVDTLLRRVQCQAMGYVSHLERLLKTFKIY